MLVALAAAVQLHSEGIGLKDAAGSSSSSGKGKVKVDATALAERIEAAAQVVKGCYSECPSYDVVSKVVILNSLFKEKARPAMSMAKTTCMSIYPCCFCT